MASPDLRFADSVALVTGAARGQGRAFAVRFAAEGADIIAVDACTRLHDRITYPPATPEDLEMTAALVRAQGRRVFAARADVRDFGALQRAVADGTQALGPLRVAVANAAVITYGRFSDLEEDEWDVVVDTNLKGVWNTLRAAVPSMIAGNQGGSIVMINSTAGFDGLVPFMHYVASKWGALGVMKAAANELGQYGIRVNAVHPGGVRTPMGDDPGIGAVVAREPLMQSAGVRVLDTSHYPNDEPDDRRVLPEDVADTVLFLASDQARFITGTSVVVDRGQSNRP